MPVTAEQVKSKAFAVCEVAAALGEAIAEAGPEGIPAGHLYGMLCDVMSLEHFNGLIALLVKAGTVTRDSSHLLRHVA